MMTVRDDHAESFWKAGLSEARGESNVGHD
jgi:hypothetical protein